MIIKKLIVNFLFTILALFLFNQAAMACRCPVILTGSVQLKFVSVQTEYETSLAVFTGEVIEADILTVKFKTEKVWKGAVGEEITMSTGAKDSGNGLIQLPSSCDYGFQKNKKYLVFGRGNNYEEMKAVKCGGTDFLEKSASEVESLDKIIMHEKRNKEAKAENRIRLLQTGCLLSFLEEIQLY